MSISALATVNRFPHDLRTLEILELIIKRGKHVLVKGFTKEVVLNCPSWDYYKSKSVHGGAISVGRRLKRMRKASLIFKGKKDDGKEYYITYSTPRWVEYWIKRIRSEESAQRRDVK